MVGRQETEVGRQKTEVSKNLLWAINEVLQDTTFFRLLTKRHMPNKINYFSKTVFPFCVFWIK